MNPFLPISLQEGIILASGSPRRQEILKGLGFEFETIPSNISEDEVLWEEPEKRSKLLAELKAVDVQKEHPTRKIIGADTIVYCDGIRMEKPANAKEAAEMLKRLSGRDHEVITGLAIVAPPNRRTIRAERTKVYFREIDNSEIERYIDTGEPFDKAGGYAIQGHASVFIEKIEGCYFNVVGLPVPLLFRMLKETG